MGSSLRIHIPLALDGICGCIRQNPQSLCLHEVQSCRDDQDMQWTAEVIVLQTGKEVMDQDVAISAILPSAARLVVLARCWRAMRRNWAERLRTMDFGRFERVFGRILK